MFSNFKKYFFYSFLFISISFFASCNGGSSSSSSSSATGGILPPSKVAAVPSN
jgi:hypothetical protein